MSSHYPAYSQANRSSEVDLVPEVNEKPRRGVSPWIKFGVPVAIIVIIGAVLGGVLGTQLNKNKSNNNSSSNPPSSSLSPQQSKSLLSSQHGALGRFATGTDSYGLPIYPSTTNPAQFGVPTFVPADVAPAAWPTDSFKPATPQVTQLRPDRPRLIAPSYKWAALPSLIQKDAYLKGWNDTIFGNATAVLNAPNVTFFVDGSSGALDTARQVKERVKNLAYAYRMSNDTTYSNRVWQELVNAAGNGTTSFGPAGDNWYSNHFLDTAELTAAFAIAYDWLYDTWTAEQRTAIMWSIITLGLDKGIAAYADIGVGWWRAVNGNWNCVSNSGLTMGAIAIYGDDPTSTSSSILADTIPNAAANCAKGPSDDGTWSETANYWYFGTTGHAEMSSTLVTAAGSDFGLMTSNPSLNMSGLYHLYVTGMTSLFNYGDCGPNKFSTTADSMMFYGDYFNIPAYTLFQRDRIDASEPTAMFWYDPSVNGAWWDGLALDHHFDNTTDQWVSMRSSWTENDGVYVAMKAGMNSGHQNHNDLDAGDFVLDAMGQRWAGELGSGDYNAPNYFVGDAASDPRWTYYRKRTEGQNTILVNRTNQVLTAQPAGTYGSTGDEQGSSTVANIPQNSTAFFTADLTETYGGTSVKRGIRFLNGRKQVLLQDDINTQLPAEWRMHTNATVSIDSAGTTATLTLGGKTLDVKLLSGPSGAKFSTAEPVRFDTDPPLPSGATDQPNPGVTVLVIQISAGQSSVQVLFNPQWSGMSASSFVTPSSVSIDDWSLTSHN